MDRLPFDRTKPPLPMPTFVELALTDGQTIYVRSDLMDQGDVTPIDNGTRIKLKTKLSPTVTLDGTLETTQSLQQVLHAINNPIRVPRQLRVNHVVSGREVSINAAEIDVALVKDTNKTNTRTKIFMHGDIKFIDAGTNPLNDSRNELKESEVIALRRKPLDPHPQV